MPPIEAKRRHGRRDGPPIAAIYGDTRVRNWAQQESDVDPGQCPLWVIRDRAVQRPYRSMSAVTPIATRMLRCRERSDVPIATNAPQQTASLFDHLVSGGESVS